LLRPAPLRGVSKPETTLSGAAVLHEFHREFVDVTLVSRMPIPFGQDLVLGGAGESNRVPRVARGLQFITEKR
jgi:hypothetical protein